MESNSKPNNVYIGALKLRNIKCFKDEHIIDFTDKDGKLHQWTVILGNNNTGKTTILRAIADLEPLSMKEFLESNATYQDVSYAPLNIIRTNEDYVTKGTKKNKEKSYIGTELLIEQFNEIFKNNWWGKEFESYKATSKLPKGYLPWGFEPQNMWQGANFKEISRLIIYGYGVNRKAGKTTITDNANEGNSSTLFEDNIELVNPEEWLIQLDYAHKSGQSKAKSKLNKVKTLLTSGILPDVEAIKFTSDKNLKNYVEFKTDYGWVRLHELGYGYRSSIAWIVDLAKKMFERYPDSENPLAEAAVVLVDELDLHLHPEWQRKIISFLTKHFPNTQFIVTAHSPLVVQSAERVNIVLLNKEDDHVTITQPDIPTFKGWTVEEILSELMNMGERTHSDAYLNLINTFEKALDENDYEKAQEAYEQLDAILNPRSSQRKLLRMQMSAIVHD